MQLVLDKGYTVPLAEGPCTCTSGNLFVSSNLKQNKQISQPHNHQHLKAQSPLVIQQLNNGKPCRNWSSAYEWGKAELRFML